MKNIRLLFLTIITAFSIQGFASRSHFSGTWHGVGRTTYGSDPSIKCEMFNLTLSADKNFWIKGEAECDGNRYIFDYGLPIVDGNLYIGDKVVGQITDSEVQFRVIGSDGTDWLALFKLDGDHLTYHEDLTNSQGDKSTLDGEFKRN